jgi:hypothetical protein
LPLLGGATIGGRKGSDQDQILNLADSSNHLLALVQNSKFALDKTTFCDLHRIVARNDALEWGAFRGEGDEVHFTSDVALGEKGRYTPLPTIAGAPQLNRVFAAGAHALIEQVPMHSNAAVRSSCSARCSGFSSTATSVRRAS